MQAASLDQAAFRGRNDDGSESTATWQATANTDWSQGTDETFRVRFLVQDTVGGGENNVNLQLQYNLNSAGWNDVNATSSVVQTSASANLTDGEDTTQQIGSGTFISPNSGVDEGNGLAGEANDIDFIDGTSDEVEVEYSATIISADVSNSDTIQLRVVRTPATLLESYTNTPTVTVDDTGPITVGATATSGAASTETAAAIEGLTVTATTTAGSALSVDAPASGVQSVVAGGSYTYGGGGYGEGGYGPGTTATNPTDSASAETAGVQTGTGDSINVTAASTPGAGSSETATQTGVTTETAVATSGAASAETATQTGVGTFTATATPGSGSSESSTISGTVVATATSGTASSEAATQTGAGSVGAVATAGSGSSETATISGTVVATVTSGAASSEAATQTGVGTFTATTPAGAGASETATQTGVTTETAVATAGAGSSETATVNTGSGITATAVATPGAASTDAATQTGVTTETAVATAGSASTETAGVLLDGGTLTVTAAATAGAGSSPDAYHVPAGSFPIGEATFGTGSQGQGGGSRNMLARDSAGNLVTFFQSSDRLRSPWISTDGGETWTEGDEEFSLSDRISPNLAVSSTDRFHVSAPGGNNSSTNRHSSFDIDSSALVTNESTEGIFDSLNASVTTADIVIDSTDTVYALGEDAQTDARNVRMVALFERTSPGVWANHGYAQDTTTGISGSGAMVIDSTDSTLHVVFAHGDPTNGDLVGYSQFDIGTGTWSVIEETIVAGQSTWGGNVVVNSAGEPIVTVGDTVYRRTGADTWSADQFTLDTVENSDLYIESDDTIHIVYTQGGPDLSYNSASHGSFATGDVTVLASHPGRAVKWPSVRYAVNHANDPADNLLDYVYHVENSQTDIAVDVFYGFEALTNAISVTAAATAGAGASETATQTGVSSPRPAAATAGSGTTEAASVTGTGTDVAVATPGAASTVTAAVATETDIFVTANVTPGAGATVAAEGDGVGTPVTATVSVGEASTVASGVTTASSGVAQIDYFEDGTFDEYDHFPDAAALVADTSVVRSGTYSLKAVADNPGDDYMHSVKGEGTSDLYQYPVEGDEWHFYFRVDGESNTDDFFVWWNFDATHADTYDKSGLSGYWFHYRGSDGMNLNEVGGGFDGDSAVAPWPLNEWLRVEIQHTPTTITAEVYDSSSTLIGDASIDNTQNWSTESFGVGADGNNPNNAWFDDFEITNAGAELVAASSVTSADSTPTTPTVAVAEAASPVSVTSTASKSKISLGGDSATAETTVVDVTPTAIEAGVTFTELDRLEIDEFDDGDVSEYNLVSSTSAYAFDSDTTMSGTAFSLRSVVGDSGADFIHSEDTQAPGEGLPNYPGANDEWHFYFQTDELQPDEDYDIMWCIPDGSAGSVPTDGLRLRISNAGDAELSEVPGGASDTAPFDWPANEWVRADVDHTLDDITVTFTDEPGNQIGASLSITPTLGYASGGFGINFQDAPTEPLWFDQFEITESGVVVAAVSTAGVAAPESAPSERVGVRIADATAGASSSPAALATGTVTFAATATTATATPSTSGQEIVSVGATPASVTASPSTGILDVDAPAEAGAVVGSPSAAGSVPALTVSAVATSGAAAPESAGTLTDTEVGAVTTFAATPSTASPLFGENIRAEATSVSATPDGLVSGLTIAPADVLEVTSFALGALVGVAVASAVTTESPSPATSSISSAVTADETAVTGTPSAAVSIESVTDSALATAGTAATETAGVLTNTTTGEATTATASPAAATADLGDVILATQAVGASSSEASTLSAAVPAEVTAVTASPSSIETFTATISATPTAGAGDPNTSPLAAVVTLAPTAAAATPSVSTAGLGHAAVETPGAGSVATASVAPAVGVSATRSFSSPRDAMLIGSITADPVAVALDPLVAESGVAPTLTTVTVAPTDATIDGVTPGRIPDLPGLRAGVSQVSEDDDGENRLGRVD